MEQTVKIEFTEEERGILCTALSFWSDNEQYMELDTYNKAIELIERIANAY